jgi:hypothetical protein
MIEERRDFERIAVLGGLPGEVMVYQPMVVRDISTGGATVETSFALHVDSLHDVRLTLGGQSVVLKGRVANSSVMEVDQETIVYRSGLEFVDSPDRVKSAIAAYIDQLKAARKGP